MAKKEVFRHYGYFEGEIAKRIFGKNADEIVVYLMDKPEDFNINKPSCDDDDTEIIYPDCICDGFQFEKNTGGYYLVRYERGNNNNEDWFIDVYSLKTDYETENDDEPKNDKDGVYEYCPHCDCEVNLENELKVQSCPKCGKKLVPCNICPLLADGKCPSLCPLSELARRMNTQFGEERTIQSFVDVFNLSTMKELERGFIINVLLNNVIDWQIRLFFNKELDTLFLINNRYSGFAITFKSIEKLTLDDLTDALEQFCGYIPNKLYIKVPK